MQSRTLVQIRTSLFALGITALSACGTHNQDSEGIIPAAQTGSSVSSAHITEYSVTLGPIYGDVAVSPSGDAYVPSSFAIVRVAPNGTQSALAIPNPYCFQANICTFARQGIAFRAADDTIWFTAEFQAGTFGSSGVVWMTSNGNVLGQTTGSAFGVTNGNVAIGPDGRAWFPQCLVVSPGNGFCALSATSETGTENDYKLGGYIGNTVAVGQDGNLYLTEVNATGVASSVAQISTSGKILRRFPLPAGSVGQNVASGLAFGHNGDLWIVENGINEIARLSPKSGDITQYPIPTANADARNIALGSDCSLWFTEFGANKIGKITGNGKITEYSIPTEGAGADGIMGPRARGCSGHGGGYVWFSEDSADAVAKVGT